MARGPVRQGLRELEGGIRGHVDHEPWWPSKFGDPEGLTSIDAEHPGHHCLKITRRHRLTNHDRVTANDTWSGVGSRCPVSHQIDPGRRLESDEEVGTAVHGEHLIGRVGADRAVDVPNVVAGQGPGELQDEPVVARLAGESSGSQQADPTT